MGDNLYFMGKVVEDKQGVSQHQHEFGKVQGVVVGGGQCFKVARDIVAQIANHSTVEAGQALNRRQAEFAQLLLYQQQWVSGIIVAWFEG
ncbi:hypothetical protein ES703_122780 [subsurface metagenome]